MYAIDEKIKNALAAHNIEPHASYGVFDDDSDSFDDMPWYANFECYADLDCGLPMLFDLAVWYCELDDPYSWAEAVNQYRSNICPEEEAERRIYHDGREIESGLTFDEVSYEVWLWEQEMKSLEEEFKTMAKTTFGKVA